jgi:hypothetical protein
MLRARGIETDTLERRLAISASQKAQKEFMEKSILREMRSHDDNNAEVDETTKEKNQEAQKRQDQETDKRRGLVPGTTAGLRKAKEGAIDFGIKLADELSDIVPIAGSAYKSFAPPGSKFNTQGSVQDKFQNFGKAVSGDLVGAVANVVVPGSGALVKQGVNAIVNLSS